MLTVGLRPVSLPSLRPVAGATADDISGMQRKAWESAWWLSTITACNGAALAAYGLWRLWRLRAADRMLIVAERPAYRPPISTAARRVWLFIAFVAMIVRLGGIQHSLWYDEIHTVNNFLSGSFKEIAADYSAPNNHILYTLILKCVNVSLPSDISRDTRVMAWRMLSVLLGTLAVVATAWSSKQVSWHKQNDAGPITMIRIAAHGFAIAALMALWPLAVDASQQVRGYALVMCLAAICTGLLPTLLEDGRGSVVYAVVCVAMLYTHPLSIVVLAPHVAAAWLTRSLRSTRLNRRFALTAFAIGMGAAQLYALVIPDAIANMREQSTPDVTRLSVMDYARCTLHDIGPRSGPVWLGIPMALIVVFGARRIWQSGRDVALLWCGPPLLLIAGGIFFPALRETRFLPIVAPHLLVLIWTGIVALYRRGFGLLAMAMVTFYLVTCAWMGNREIHRMPVQAYREACAAGIGQEGRTVAIGLGAPETVFYRADMLKAFTAPDLRALMERFSVSRLVVPYPQTWLARENQRALRNLIESEFAPDQKHFGRLRQDPAILTYRRITR